MISKVLWDPEIPPHASIGKLDIIPNIANVIPGKATFTLDIRHPESDSIENFCQRILEQYSVISEQKDIQFEYIQYMDTTSVEMHKELTDMLLSICEEHNMSYHIMDSGAGHDAQIFAPHCPSALLFVPSKGCQPLSERIHRTFRAHSWYTGADFCPV